MTVTYYSMENLDGTFTEYALIDWGNGEFTSMTKTEYDKEFLSE
jgi:hypothetical protein